MKSWKLWLPLLGIVSLMLLNAGCTQLASGDSAKEITAIRGDVAVPFVFRTVSVQQPVKDQDGVPISEPARQAEPRSENEQPVVGSDATSDTSQLADVLADVYPNTDQAPPLPTTDLASSAPPPAQPDNKEIYPDPADTKVKAPEPPATRARTGHWERRRVGLLRWNNVWVSGPQARASSTSNRKDGGRGSCTSSACGR